MKNIPVIIVTILVGLMLMVGFTPMGRAMYNNYVTSMRKVDDRTMYETRKRVEDEARAMVASYKADSIKYTQYKDSEDKEQKSWGEQAKMRANTTATTFNEFMLKNSFVFNGNIPQDINFQLQILP